MGKELQKRLITSSPHALDPAQQSASSSEHLVQNLGQKMSVHNVFVGDLSLLQATVTLYWQSLNQDLALLLLASLQNLLSPKVFGKRYERYFTK